MSDKPEKSVDVMTVMIVMTVVKPVRELHARTRTGGVQAASCFFGIRAPLVRVAGAESELAGAESEFVGEESGACWCGIRACR